MASYGPTGSGRWAAAVEPRSFGFLVAPPIMGPLGFDFATASGVQRSNLDGVLVSSIPIPASLGSSVAIYEIAQLADGSALMFGAHAGLISADCTRIAATHTQGFIATLDAQGGCIVHQVMTATGGLRIAGTARAGGGYLVVATVVNGSLTLGPNTVTTTTRKAVLASYTADHQLEWFVEVPEEFGEPGELVGADDRGNTYWVTRQLQGNGTLHSYRSDGVERWSAPISVANGSFTDIPLTLAVNRHGELALVVLVSGDLTIGSLVFPGSGLHYEVVLLEGR